MTKSSRRSPCRTGLGDLPRHGGHDGRRRRERGQRVNSEHRFLGEASLPGNFIYAATMGFAEVFRD